MREMILFFEMGKHAAARQLAHRFRLFDIATTLVEVYGYSENKAHAVACYLKGSVTLPQAQEIE